MKEKELDELILPDTAILFFLRHLVMAKSNDLNPYPNIIAELGPGDSLGIGLAVLISGCGRYLTLDIVKYATAESNLAKLDELVTLFINRATIPDNDGFPNIKLSLNKYDFPDDILDEYRLQQSLAEPGINKIRDSIVNFQLNDSAIQYMVPWYDASVIEKKSVDLIYSQAVLEHVDDLPNTYHAMRLWLKPNGYMSHQIDFKCHNSADEWNGHWTYSDFQWKLMKGKRPYLLNREPHSTHIAILNKEKFCVVCDIKIESRSNLTKSSLASRFRSISDDDLITSGAFIQAVKIKVILKLIWYYSDWVFIYSLL